VTVTAGVASEVPGPRLDLDVLLDIMPLIAAARWPQCHGLTSLSARAVGRTVRAVSFRVYDSPLSPSGALQRCQAAESPATVPVMTRLRPGC
jgi:hypothetical protein